MITTTISIEDMIKETIQDYDRKRLFTDDMLLDLLSDNIAKKTEEDMKILKRQIKKEKHAVIDNFIKIIRNVYFVEGQGLTVVIWKDGTRTEVKCQDGDVYNKEAGLALCIIKYLFGNTNYYNEIFKSVFEKQANPAEEKTSVKKTKKAPPKKKKSSFSRKNI